MRKKTTGIDALEEARLARLWRIEGDARALSILVESHMGLVVKRAQEIARRTVSLEDLIQEGNMGLLVAAKRFDERKGARLATYATFWIRAYMLKYALRNYGPVKVSTTNARERVFFRLGRARRDLGAYGTEVDLGALAAQIGVSVEDAQQVVAYIDAAGGAHESDPDEGATQPDEGADVWLASAVDDALSDFKPRDREIVRLRFSEDATYGQISAVVGISAQRVRQIACRAQRKLQKRFKNAGLKP